MLVGVLRSSFGTAVFADDGEPGWQSRFCYMRHTILLKQAAESNRESSGSYDHQRIVSGRHTSGNGCEETNSVADCYRRITSHAACCALQSGQQADGSEL